MTDIADFTAEDLAKGAEHPALGAAYFAARRISQHATEGFKAEHIEPLIKEAADRFYEKLQGAVEDHLWADAEMNLQGRSWRMVDQIVEGLLSGEKWVMDRYVLADRYDCKKVRESVAKHVPAELQDKRIADLEAEVEKLKRDVRMYRDSDRF